MAKRPAHANPQAKARSSRPGSYQNASRETLPLGLSQHCEIVDGGLVKFRRGGIMVEPFSVGGLVALALSTATEAVVKGTVEEATKDAYNALKEKLSRLSSSDVEALERSPKAVGRQVTIAEIVDAQPKDEQELLRLLAQALAAAMDKRISPDDFIIQKTWKAGIFKREDKAFVITFSHLNEHHRLECNISSFSFSHPVELDGTEIFRFRWTGKQTVSFTTGDNYDEFQLRFNVSTFLMRISKIELSAENKLILQLS